MPSVTLKVLAVMPGITADAGAERSFVDMVPYLVDAGIELHLALLTDRQVLVPEVEAAGARVHDLSEVGGLVERVRAIRSLVSDFDVALVHATLYEAAVPAQLAVVGLPARMLVTWANTSYTPAHLASVGATRTKLRLAQLSEIVLSRLSSARFHAVTGGVARVNAPLIRVPADRVFVGERGRDPLRFDVPAEDLSRLIEEFSAPGGTRFIVAVGRQDVQKGYPSLLEQFDRLAASRADVHLVVAGREGSDTARLQELLRTLTYSDRVHLLGHRADVPALLALADVVTCSSWREGAAGALIEAMASGAPIVSVALDGLDEVLVDEDNALVVPREEIGAAIGRLLDDPVLAARLSTNGRRTFEDRFTIERSGRRLAEIYWAVAG